MSATTIFLLLGVICGIVESVDYCVKFGGNHTMCLYPANSGCKKMASGVDGKAIEQILNAHNKYRQLVANGKQSDQPKASNMREFVWDAELARVAQRWADQCKFGHDKKRTTEKFFTFVGQNVASTGGVDNSTADFMVATTMWFNEVSLFDARNIDPFQFDMKTGHYTQLVWAETYAIGCGYSYYTSENLSTKYYVCNYGPGGNVIGTKVYKKGTHCSTCEGACSKKYPGLCQVVSPK